MLKSSGISFLPNHIIGYTPNKSTHVMSTIIHVDQTFNILHNSLSIDSINVHVATLHCTFLYNDNKGEWFSLSFLHKMHV